MKRLSWIVALPLVMACKKAAPIVDAGSVAGYLQAPEAGCAVGGAPAYGSADALEQQMTLSVDAHASDEYTRSLLTLKREPCGTRVLILTKRTFKYKAISADYDEVEIIDGADKGARYFVLDEVVRLGSPPASSVAVADASTEAGRPPKTAQDLANEHREEMETAAKDGRYDDVCAGTPAVPSAICGWVAARAQGKAATKPDWTVFLAFINREHIKKVSGRIVGDGDGKGEYEVIVYGYRRHCILTTFGTEFTTKGAFSLWVQELPETREITTNGGGSENWVELEENDLGKDLSDLTFARGVEAEALAKDIIMEVAKFVPYAELKGDFPDASAPPAPVASAGTTATATAKPTAAPLGVAPPPPAVDADAKAKARSDCLRSCVAGCKDDATCEMDCATKKCPK